MTLHKSFRGTGIEKAATLLEKLLKEDRFWKMLEVWVGTIDLKNHPLLLDDKDIIPYLRTMFSFNLNIAIVPYTSKNPWSSVLGYAEGNKIYENTRKINSLSLTERTGHLGHEAVHLLGLSHDHQGQDNSVPVIFGRCMERYAEIRLQELLK